MGNSEDGTQGVGGLLAVVAVLAIIVFAYPLLLAIPLVDPDEGLHAAIAQEMVERGDWVMPRFLGQPFLDKPIFYTWTQALSLKLLGMHEAAVRLPGLVFGFLAMLSTGLLGWRMSGRTVGVVAAIFYSTMILPSALAQVAAHDVALIPWVNVSVLLFWEADRAACLAADTATWRRSLALAAAVGLFLGLACLTKGLVGVGLVGTAYGCYLLVTRRLTLGACLRGAIALAVAALAASVWYVAMERRSPGYLYYYFVDRHLLGFTTETQKHGREPLWYYLPILLGGGLPWIPYVPVMLPDWWKKWRSPHPNPLPKGEGATGSFLLKGEGALRNYRSGGEGALRAGSGPAARSDAGGRALLWCWLIGCTFLLSAAHSKMVTYLWPVFPPTAVLAAVVWGRLFEGRLSMRARSWFAWVFLPSTFVAPLILFVGMIVAQEVMGIRFTWGQWAIGAAAALSTWTALGFWRYGRYRGVLASGTLALGAQFAVGMAVIAPPMAAVHTASDLAAYFNGLGRVPSKIVVIEDRIGSLVFYLEPEIRATLKPGQLVSVRAQDAHLLKKPKPDAVIALAESRVKISSPHLNLAGVGFRRWGRYRLYTPVELEALLVRATTAGTRAYEL